MRVKFHSDLRMQGVNNSNELPRLAALNCVLGDLSQADGSASLTHGNTSVLAAVYGPCEVKVSKEILDQATVEVTFRPKVGLPNCASKFCEKHVRDLFQEAVLVHSHPRSSITIVLQELEDDGALLATGINAACLALLDAGVNMKFMVAAVMAVIDKDEKISLGPREKDSATDISGSLLFVINDKNLDIMGMTSSGKFSKQQYDRCLLLCREAVHHIFQFYRDSLHRKLSKSL